MSRNPFKPTAGATPPVLVGREPALEELDEALDDGAGSPYLLQFVTGARGAGKTVMLTEMGRRARERGWIVVDETATPGLLTRLTRAVRHHREQLGSPDRSRISGVGLNILGTGGDVRMEGAPREAPDLRDEIGALCDAMDRHDGETGLIITVDEIHTIRQEELDELAAIIQHLIREDRSVGLLMAGIPQAVEQMIADNAQRPKVSTFLRRAERTVLEHVPLADVAAAFQQTISEGGRSISEEVAWECARATSGYPFMIQLVGFHTWRVGREGPVTREHVTQGRAKARKRLGELVHAPALRDLSAVDRTFLTHMSVDDGPSRYADLRTRMGETPNYISVYRDRLIRAGMIQPSAVHGHVEFALPELRGYLREHAAQLVAEVNEDDQG
ncbi:ATP-binding protein [Nesterenkonia aerolata]|uniref:ATP-binding protein n=1 Tax=Nesterenkonia aerolata TaxID=3074079 RepID=A0ABU2DQU3_9MICC|nr:ATP-binding protein [Nesterenkonia sp. LY-0111]MDR8018839.1 ATP-binding protein [Nesterenkonia sp. LY-0111]